MDWHSVVDYKNILKSFAWKKYKFISYKYIEFFFYIIKLPVCLMFIHLQIEWAGCFCYFSVFMYRNLYNKVHIFLRNALDV